MATYIGYSTIGKISGSRRLTDVDLAKRDLLNHFYTRKGERVQNPNFGSILHDLVFDPLDTATEEIALDDVNKIINSDPRWTPLETVLSKPDEHSLDIRVRLTYNDTGTAEELYLTYVGEIE
tara:strand:- start:24 stop:389 length:366 start_codon:yes stop_codon:yes gene_type:complete